MKNSSGRVLHKPCFHIAMILLLGIAAYANSLSGPQQFDDQAVVRVYNNMNIDLHSLGAQSRVRTTRREINPRTTALTAAVVRNFEHQLSRVVSNSSR
jgi:hypothetical protein